ncbi:MAG TPA: helix-turn-helix domain-containing protein [Nocardioides sp.]
MLQRRSRASVADRARDRGALAAVVAARRQELDLTQGDLADLASVARGSVVSLEAGRTVSLDVLLSLLDVLGLHLELTTGAARGVEVSRPLATHFGLADGDDEAGPGA